MAKVTRDVTDLVVTMTITTAVAADQAHQTNSTVKTAAKEAAQLATTKASKAARVETKEVAHLAAADVDVDPHHVGSTAATSAEVEAAVAHQDGQEAKTIK